MAKKKQRNPNRKKNKLASKPTESNESKNLSGNKKGQKSKVLNLHCLPF